MPKTNKRRFVDPRKSVTFEIVPRNQVDPLAADNSAPKNVLVEKISQRAVELEYHSREIPIEKRLEEQRKYGIYFDDDYNYLQHLRDVRVVGEMERVIRIDKQGGQVEINCEIQKEEKLSQEKPLAPEHPRISLPSSVFPSHVEEHIGHLHKGVSTKLRPDWDPDVIAALDDDFECDELEDDFVALASGGAHCIEDLGAGDEEFTARRFYYSERESANAFENIEACPGSDDNRMLDASCSSNDDEGEYDEIKKEHKTLSMGGRIKFADEEIQSKFTSYSLSSAAMSRTGGLKTLDDQFELMFGYEYGDKDVGALDGENIEGSVPIESDVVNKLSKQYEKAVSLNSGVIETSIGEPNSEVKMRVMKSLQDIEKVEVLDLVDNDTAPDGRKWDCESILSTYSNLYNRPKIIDVTAKNSTKIHLGAKGVPTAGGGLTKQALKKLDGDFVKADDYAKFICSRARAVGVLRAKNESPKERKARKQQVKEFRRERRIEKKINTLSFKTEEYRQKEQECNARKNLRGLKLQ
ncbi:protein LTV1 homolog isoform X2 [Varroa destructor]|uniref:Protein LTV1 homolog n=1 Tax=Varroa destructor TaxID=109461 RepID=A0A7M7JEP2_VARDE|nr:protein LTV1 homolog isoform X2 [Varroa destructor]